MSECVNVGNVRACLGMDKVFNICVLRLLAYLRKNVGVRICVHILQWWNDTHDTNNACMFKFNVKCVRNCADSQDDIHKYLCDPPVHRLLQWNQS